MEPVELMQLGIVCASFFAAWKLEAISRSLGEVTTHIEHLKEDVTELKDEFGKIHERVDKAENQLKDILKFEKEHSDG